MKEKAGAAESPWDKCRAPEDCLDLWRELVQMIKEITQGSELYEAEDANAEIPIAHLHWRGPGYYARGPWRVEEGRILMEITQVEESRESFDKALEAARWRGFGDLRWANTPEEAAWPYKIKQKCRSLFEVCPELDPDNWPDPAFGEEVRDDDAG